MSKKDSKKVSETEKDLTNDVIQPEIIENKIIPTEIKLKKGECLVKTIATNEEFVTSVNSAEKYFSDPAKYEVVKKNQ